MTIDEQPEPAAAAPAPDVDAPTMDATAALAWLDGATGEFFGAVEECARHIAAGVTEPNMTLETSARLNTFMLKLMEIAQQGHQSGAAQQLEAQAAGA